MSAPIWIFFSDILIVITVWAFILEFNGGFNREEDLEKIAHEIILNRSKPPLPR